MQRQHVTPTAIEHMVWRTRSSSARTTDGRNGSTFEVPGEGRWIGSEPADLLTSGAIQSPGGTLLRLRERNVFFYPPGYCRAVPTCLLGGACAPHYIIQADFDDFVDSHSEAEPDLH